MTQPLKPGLTVVVPFYNVEPYIEKAVRSILASKVSPLTVIAVDDCGTDASMEIVRRLANEDPRVTIVKNDQNRGLAYSRNHGLDYVSTEYVAFLDSDDWVAEDFYDRLYERITAQKADVAVGNVLYAYPESGYCREEWVSFWTFRSRKTVITAPEDKQDLIYACACWNKIYRTDFLRRIGAQFPVGLFVEDVPFTFRAVALAKKIVLDRDTSLFYRQRSDSIMKDLKKSRRVFDVFQITDLCYKALSALPEKEQPVFRQILDHFQIFNLYSWSTAVHASDKEQFRKIMLERFRKISIANNPFVTPEHRRMYNEILGRQVQWRVRLFGCIPIGTLPSSHWLCR